MLLSEWMAENNVRPVDLARKLFVDRSLISHWLADRKRPSVRLAARIERVTDGAVSLREALLPHGSGEAADDNP